VNPIAFMYLMLGLMAVVALAMCAAVVADGVREGEYKGLRRRGQPRKNGSDGAGLAGLLRRRAAAVAAAWARVGAALKNYRPAPTRAARPLLVADARVRVGPGRNPGESGLPADQRVVPPTATGPFIDAVTVAQRAAQYRQALTPEQRWPHLQRQWSENTGEFAALVDAMGGQP
jgi:hypothetical protein